MTPDERVRVPRIASLLFTLIVGVLAAVVLFQAAAVLGLSPLDSGPDGTPGPFVGAAAPSSAPSTAPTARPGSSVAALGAPASVGPSGSPAQLVVASALPAASITLSASASPASNLKPAPTSGPFAIDLYRSGDFVSEMDKVSCVPAAMQTMINIMSPGADTSIATQKKLYALSRRLSPETLKGPGAEPEGWAAGLTQLGFGAYMVAVQPTRTAAIKAAATALRLTGRPVGILAWRGAHSWVMSGFRATADPALTNSFTVTAVNIEDVWYPRVSTIWGASRKPDTLVAVGLLPEDMLPWHRPSGAYPGKDGKYVLVLPVGD